VRRLLLLTALIALVAAACGGDDTGVAESIPGSTTEAAGGTTTAAASGGTVTPNTAGESTTTAAAGTTTTSTTTTVPQGPPPTLWASDSAMGVVLQIDPVSGELLTETDIGGNAESIAFGGGSVWVVSNLNGEVARIDPSTGELLDLIATDPNTAGIAFAAGYVFAGAYGDGPDFDSSVTVIDAVTGGVVATIDVPNGATGMVSDGTAVYGATFLGGEVYRIEAEPGFTTVSAPVGEGLSELAVVGVELWVTNPPLSTVYRLDPATLTPIGQFDSLDANFITYGAGYAWISGPELVAVEAGTGDRHIVPIQTGAGMDAGPDALFVGSLDGAIYRVSPAEPWSEPEVLFERPGAAFFDVALGNGL
jgi:hypothetical protein